MPRDNGSGRVRRAWLYVILSLVSVVVASTVRLYYGIMRSVPVLILEGYHALLDAFTLALVVVALMVARSKWAARFPYGLYRLEDLAALLLAIVIVYALFEHVARGAEEPPSMPIDALSVQAASIPLLAASAWFRARAARLLRSPGLAADAAHMMVDVVESTAVTLGLVAYWVTRTSLAYRVADLLATLGLALAAYEAAHDSILSLLDLPRDPRLVEEARRIAEEAVGKQASIARLRARWAGPAVFIEVVLRVHPLMTIDAASRIARRVEDALRARIEGVEDVTVSIEPTHRERLRIVIPLDEPSLDTPPSRHFARAPYMLLASLEKGILQSAEIVETNKIVRHRDPLLTGAELAETLHEKGVTDAIVVNIGELAYALLLRHKILVWKADPAATAKANIEKLARGELELLEEPTHEAPWRKRIPD